MTRRIATRTTLVTLGLATLAACIVNLSFAMDKPMVAIKSDAGTTNIGEHKILVDLGEYPEITEHKGNIKSLDLDFVDVTITSVGSGNTASTVNGKVTLRKNLTDPASADIAVGTLTAFQLQQGKTVRINGTPQLDQFLFEQLQNAGKFYVVVSGSIDHGAADVVADLNLHASIGYDAGIF